MALIPTDYIIALFGLLLSYGIATITSKFTGTGLVWFMGAKIAFNTQWLDTSTLTFKDLPNFPVNFIFGICLLAMGMGGVYEAIEMIMGFREQRKSRKK